MPFRSKALWAGRLSFVGWQGATETPLCLPMPNQPGLRPLSPRHLALLALPERTFDSLLLFDMTLLSRAQYEAKTNELQRSRLNKRNRRSRLGNQTRRKANLLKNRATSLGC